MKRFSAFMHCQTVKSSNSLKRPLWSFKLLFINFSRERSSSDNNSIGFSSSEVGPGCPLPSIIPTGLNFGERSCCLWNSYSWVRPSNEKLILEWLLASLWRLACGACFSPANAAVNDLRKRLRCSLQSPKTSLKSPFSGIFWLICLNFLAFYL